MAATGNQPDPFAGLNPLDWLTHGAETIFGLLFGSGSSNPVSDWLKGLGADIGSGIESGVLAVFKDLWKVIAPFVEIAAGIIVIAFAVGLAFKDDLLALAPIAAAAAL